MMPKSRARLQLDIIGQAHLPDHFLLRFYEIDMLFLGGEDLGKQIARREIAHRILREQIFRTEPLAKRRVGIDWGRRTGAGESP